MNRLVSKERPKLHHQRETSCFLSDDERRLLRLRRDAHLSKQDEQWLHAKQCEKTPFDNSRDPREYDDGEIDAMVSEFVRVWRFGLIETVKVRGMGYNGEFFSSIIRVEIFPILNKVLSMEGKKCCLTNLFVRVSERK